MVKRTQRILQAVGATVCPESWYSFEMRLLRMARVLTFTEANTKHPALVMDVAVRRSPQAVACRKRCAVELGKPHRLLVGGRPSIRYTDRETRKGKPGNRVMPEPKRTEGSQLR